MDEPVKKFIQCSGSWEGDLRRSARECAAPKTFSASCRWGGAYARWWKSDGKRTDFGRRGMVAGLN